MPQNIRLAVRTTTDHYPVDPTIIVELRVNAEMNLDHRSSIEAVAPTILLVRWIHPNQIAQTANIIANQNYQFISIIGSGLSGYHLFRTRINQNEFTTALQDGEYYSVQATSAYLTGHNPIDPYKIDGPPLYLKWNSASGTFTSAQSVSTGSAGVPIFGDYEPADPSYRSFNPLTIPITFRGSLPKGGGGGREEKDVD
jgi:hypothetical protein